MLARLAPLAVLVPLPAQVELLANFNTERRTGYVSSGEFGPLTRAGAHLVFAGSARDTGRELWATDGKPGTTRLLVDIHPADSGRPTALVSDGARTWFVADDGVHGPEVWGTDGTAAGTRLVSDLAPGRGQSFANLLTPFAGGLAFVANDGQVGTELWFSDGTAAGTRLVRDVNPGPLPAGISEIAVMGGALWFTADDGAAGQELWRSDGTRAGTQLFLDLVPGGGHSTPRDFAVDPTGNRLLFTATSPTTGRELWVTDGTVAGTRLVADLTPGSGDSLVTAPPVFAGGLWFVGLSVARGTNMLWRSDGTAAGTLPLPQVRPSILWPVGRRVLCAATDALGSAVYLSDGTVAGTQRLAGTTAEVVAAVPGGVWFGSSYTGELWFSDLTPRGTRKLAAQLALTSLAATDAGDVVATAIESMWHVARTGQATLLHAAPRRIDAGAEPRDMVSAGTFALGTALSGGRARIFRTDGTARGTWLTAANLGPAAQPAGVALGRVLLTGPSGGVGSRLFAHDGGTGPAIDLLPTSAGVTSPLVPRQGGALFIAADPSYGEEPWVTDGTPQGTRLLLDITPGPSGTSRRAPIVIDERRFALPTDDDRFLIWSDGTTAGTRRLALPALPSSPTYAACRAHGRLLLSSNGALWACDGRSFSQPAPNVWSSQLVEHAGQAWLVDRVTGTLWRSDGTSAGTAPVLTLPSREFWVLTSWRGGLVCGDGSFTLWWTDGTAAGTRVLMTLPSSVAEVRAWSDDLLVVRQAPMATGALGSRLWLVRADGTQQLAALHTGPYPTMFAPVAGRLVFAHDDGPLGSELWAFAPGAAATDVASGCGGTARLVASAPRLGARLAVRGDVAPGAFVGALWLGVPLRPMPHGAGCALAGDLTVLVDAFWLASTQFARALPLPTDSSLLGTEWVLQAMFASPLGTELSHGVHLRVGR